MTTETIIQNRFYYDFWQAFHVILPNVHIDEGSEMDLFCIRNSGYCEEFEIKLTVSDFKADFKKTLTTKNEERNPLTYSRYSEKPKHELIEKGLTTANRFNFILPEELVDKVEIPEYAGIYVFKIIEDKDVRYSRTSIIKKRQGKLLHKNKVTLDIYKKCCNKYQPRFWDLRNKD